MSDPFLIVGLGNPGDRYRDTRHNIGFAVVDVLAERWRTTFSKKFKGEFAQVAAPSDAIPPALLLKPQTFMNLSGESVVPAVQFFKVPFTNVLVITDDLDLPVGSLRLRLKGGTGGHNGLKSITQLLGTDEYPRLRIGIGRAPGIPADVHVLAKIPAEERAVYEQTVLAAADGVERCLKEGVAKAMNTVNVRSEPK